MPPLFGIHSLKTSVHHPLWLLLERSSKPISTQRLILLSSTFLMVSPWCRPVLRPRTLNLPIAVVLLRLRVHSSVEIKRYKSQIRIRIRIGRRGFSVAAPAEWNKLPQTVRSQQTIDGFRSQLKTHLFRLAYPHLSYTLVGAF